MAEKISTLILNVNLDCLKCYKKIRKILCKIQDQEKITTISFEKKSNMIVIAGTFDAQRLCCKIRCKGGKVIKDTRIVDGGKPPAKMAEQQQPPPPTTTTMNNSSCKKKGKKEKHGEMIMPPAAAPAENMPPPPAQHAPAPPEREISAVVVPAIIEETTKPRDRPVELISLTPPVAPVAEKEKPRDWPPPPAPAKPFYPAEVTTTVEIPSWPAPPPPVVGPCYQGYYEGCRCGHCGRVYGYAAVAETPLLLPPPSCYSGGAAGTPYCVGYGDCRLISEDPTAACTIM
ncbi:hypothetical protein GUJ93_ZPchr0011g28562 [Zizania palustris]|uniref:HMA domain-containing protein n=1 Tax=Zizania palustris TaxID=103762 RepID=A0A8J5WG54_ZIZPA|nr:hypothetical protein GUJ93_ZPchr0011g28562 [Zizania palustris]